MRTIIPFTIEWGQLMDIYDIVTTPIRVTEGGIVVTNKVAIVSAQGAGVAALYVDLVSKYAEVGCSSNGGSDNPPSVFLCFGEHTIKGNPESEEFTTVTLLQRGGRRGGRTSVLPRCSYPPAQGPGEQQEGA